MFRALDCNPCNGFDFARMHRYLLFGTSAMNAIPIMHTDVIHISHLCRRPGQAYMFHVDALRTLLVAVSLSKDGVWSTDRRFQHSHDQLLRGTGAQSFGSACA